MGDGRPGVLGIKSAAQSEVALVGRAAREAFLSAARILDERGPTGRSSWRVTLDDGKMQHSASVETADDGAPNLRGYRFSIAAYEVDKALDLNFVVPTVERPVNGHPAAVIWWLDDVAMSELSRRKAGITPPDVDRWNQQVQVVRIFDELVGNAYRDINPELYLSTSWDNLVIAKDWRVWLVDHTRTFQTRRSLNFPESLARCERALLRKLRALNNDTLTTRLSKYLSGDELAAFDARRRLILKHFDGQIASRGESAVLFDLPPRP